MLTRVSWPLIAVENFIDGRICWLTRHCNSFLQWFEKMERQYFSIVSVFLIFNTFAVFVEGFSLLSRSVTPLNYMKIWQNVQVLNYYYIWRSLDICTIYWWMNCWLIRHCSWLNDLRNSKSAPPLKNLLREPLQHIKSSSHQIVPCFKHKIKSHQSIAKFLMWTWEAWQSWCCVYWGGIRVCHLLYIFASVRLRVFLLVLLRLPKSLPVLILLLYNLHD